MSRSIDAFGRAKPTTASRRQSAHPDAPIGINAYRRRSVDGLRAQNGASGCARLAFDVEHAIAAAEARASSLLVSWCGSGSS